MSGLHSLMPSHMLCVLKAPLQKAN